MEHLQSFDTHSFLLESLIFLVAAVISVPIAKRLGLSAVLGYLIAGIIIGPWGLSFIDNSEDILHFAEFGVVMFLFLIGLELEPRRLWSMRKFIFGQGSLQVFLTFIMLCFFSLLINMTWTSALIIGMAFALSSTAIALQTLTEKNLLKTAAGESAFGILLFQDLVVIPMLAIIPLLGHSDKTNDSNIFLSVLFAFSAISAIILIGHYLIRPIFRFIASARIREIFTAFSLMLIIGIALLMEAVGLSMALGAFLAGVVLAESEYKHELEINIEPFKGLLLGLFFISVGMSINIDLFLNNFFLVIALVLLLILAKGSLLLGLAIFFDIPASQRLFLSFLLSQGGEFAFVILSLAINVHIIDEALLDILFVVVALSMLTTPLLLLIEEKFIAPRFRRVPISTPKEEKVTIDNQENPVIIAGFGRVGQIIGRVLHANKIGTTILDHDIEHISRMQTLGFKVFYGDAAQIELLEAAGVYNAKIFVIAVDDKELILKMVDILQKHFPHLTIVARAYDVVHAFKLQKKNVHILARETFDSSLVLAEEILKQLGVSAFEAKKRIYTFREHDLETLEQVFFVWSQKDKRIKLIQESREEIEDLIEKLFLEDRKSFSDEDKW